MTSKRYKVNDVDYIYVEAEATGTSFIPARTLFVSQAWSTGSDPLVFFTKISDALTQAATLTPRAFNPVTIIVYPGTYSDPLTLVSNVHFFGNSYRDVLIDAPVTWTPGAGVNAAQASIREEIDFAFIHFNAPTASISVDSTAKLDDSNSVLDMRDCDVRNGATIVSRPGQIDYFQVWSSICTGNFSFTNTNTNMSSISAQSGNWTWSGNCAIDWTGGEILANSSLNGTSTGRFSGLEVAGTVYVGPGCHLNLPGSYLDVGSVLTVDVGGTADIRAGEYNVQANLVGPGTIDRNIWRTNIIGEGSTLIGANAITIDPPLPNNDYVVAVTLTSAAGGVMPSVTAKTGSGFTLNDTVGTRTFDLMVLRG
jgi:hypothetical protein